ncbi:MAG: pyridoxal-phosphate dependent enzyme, partial [Oscillospiraceae bacterium]|nr:pyridoxal-phosphate dependent enzyme [Oscillospiraceae bacterium]
TKRIADTHYVIGSVVGPHPFPMMVRDFQAVISRESRAQILELEGELPSAVIACAGGGSNAMGAFFNYVDDVGVDLIACEAGGHGVDTDKHAATLTHGTPGIFHGMKTLFCQDNDGQIAPVHSISAGLDYPGIGPELAHLATSGRAKFAPITDKEAVAAFEYLARTEGIIPAIESSHAVAQAIKVAKDYSGSIIVNISGRGDKDVASIARYTKYQGGNVHE